MIFLRGGFLYANNEYSPVLTAVPSLMVSPDARGAALGDAGCSLSVDENAQFWNPAKYPYMGNEWGGSLTYVPWMQNNVGDINLAYLAGYYKISNFQAVSGSLRYFSYGEIELSAMPGSAGQYVSLGVAKPYEFSLDCSFSQRLSRYWSAAVTLRFLLSDLSNGQSSIARELSTGKAVCADISGYYTYEDRLYSHPYMFSFGAIVSNIGNKVSYDKGYSRDFLPANLKVGSSFNYSLDYSNDLALSVDLNKLLVPSVPLQRSNETTEDYNKRLEHYKDRSTINGVFVSFTDAPGGFKEEMKEIAWSLGLEYAYNKHYFLRTGYYHESKFKGNRQYVSFGGGCKVRTLCINAAYLLSTTQRSLLDKTFCLTIGYSFNKYLHR